MINIPITTVLSQRHNPATEIVWKIFNICSLVVVRIKQNAGNVGKKPFYQQCQKECINSISVDKSNDIVNQSHIDNKEYFDMK